MKYFTHSLRILGMVKDVDLEKRSFQVQCRSGDVFEVFVAEGTGYFFIKNFDRLDRDRMPKFEGYDHKKPADRLKRYIRPDILVAAYGVYQIHEDQKRFDAKEIWLFQNQDKNYLFEETHWWLTQITALADQWLLNIFGASNTFDFTNYQTNLSYIGSKTTDTIQECATLSRLIYGLASAYLMTGNERYYQAAKNGVEYQRDTFRTESHDGSFIVWAHAYDKVKGRKIMPSLFGDDLDAIPLYEQIYALAGLTQFYRISNDWELLDDIRRTMEFFNKIFLDQDKRGYFSHIDPVTFSYDTPALGKNVSRKNWNSIGDHTPAYLLNLMLALENIPEPDLDKLYKECKKMQRELADLIVKHFPDPNQDIPYVRERFTRDWVADEKYEWQQNRAVVGHNLKIAWNLTRVYSLLPEKKSYLELAKKLANDMKIHGLDQIRGGWFDVVERKPQNNMPIEFTWHNRKAWWQQEQGILAYLIMHGATGNPEYLQLARESISFWNMTYLDFDYGDVHFMVTDDGLPYTKDVEAMKGSHSKSGYHVFELNFLTNIYIRTFVTKTPFRLYFKPSGSRRHDFLSVQPDYLPKGSLTLGKVYVDGVEHRDVITEDFLVKLPESTQFNPVEIAVEFIPNKDYKPEG